MRFAIAKSADLTPARKVDPVHSALGTWGVPCGESNGIKKIYPLPASDSVMLPLSSRYPFDAADSTLRSRFKLEFLK